MEISIKSWINALDFVTLPHRNWIFMIRKLPSAASRDLFRTRLSDLISQYFYRFTI
jgi:hypothetical protein